MEEAVNDTMTAFYGSPEVKVDGAWRQMHTDNIGSVWAVSSTTGTVTDAYVYDAFGNNPVHDGSTNSPYTYAGGYGYYKSGVTGLYLLQARHYDAAAGRFISADPIGYEGGLNVYQYVGNAPVRWTDPLGLFTSLTGCAKVPWACTGMGIGAGEVGRHVGTGREIGDIARGIVGPVIIGIAIPVCLQAVSDLVQCEDRANNKAIRCYRRCYETFGPGEANRACGRRCHAAFMVDAALCVADPFWNINDPECAPLVPYQ